MRKQHSLCVQEESSKRENDRELNSQVVMETTQYNVELTSKGISLLFKNQNVQLSLTSKNSHQNP